MKRAARTRRVETTRPCTASEAFDALWARLSDVIGPTATAALIQRSVKRASASAPELRQLLIARQQFADTYTLPSSWAQPAPEPSAALAHVVQQLWPLLSGLTGSVVVRRLQEDPVLQRCGVIPRDMER